MRRTRRPLQRMINNIFRIRQINGQYGADLLYKDLSLQERHTIIEEAKASLLWKKIK